MKRKAKKPKRLTPTQQIGALRAHNETLRERLHYAEKSRNALAKLVDPLAVARIHLLTERNVNLELAVVLTRQVAKALRDSWARQGYPTDMVDAFEQDLNRLLGD